jgi:Tfp pilus assembly PilM family ATPase
VRAAQLSRSNGSWRLEAAASLPRTNADTALSEADARRLWDVLGRQNFTGDKAVIGLPEESLTSALIKVEQGGSAANREKYIWEEFARASSLDPNRSEMAYWELPTPSRSDHAVDVMAVGCTHADAEGLLDAAESTGLEVAALDASSAAVGRWLTCHPGGPPRSALRRA